MTAASATAWLTACLAEQRAVSRKLYCFGIDRTGDLIGVIKLRVEGTTAALSYILRDDAWGHGYATTAVALVLDFAFRTLRLTSVNAKHHPDNHASAQVLTKTGFTRTGHCTYRVATVRS